MTTEAARAAAIAAIAAGHPIATRTEGWSWGSIGIWLFGLLCTPAVIIGLFKLVAALRKLANEREAAEDSSSLAGFKAVVEAQAAEIGRMTARIDKLEREQAAERERHATEVRQLAASHEAELGLHRHIARNAKQVLYSFLDLIEAKPDDAAATAAKIRRRMEEYERQEAEESARIRGARIIAAATPAPAAPDPTL